MAAAYEAVQSGDAEAALREMERLRELQEREVGRDHADVFATRTMIVTLTAQLFRFDEALGLAARMLTDQQRVFGADHPNTLRTRSTLAFLNAQKGDLDLAVDLFNALLEDQKRILGDGNADVTDAAVRATHHELAFTRIQKALLAAPDRSTSEEQAQLPDLNENPEVALDQLVSEFVVQVAAYGRRHPHLLALRSLLSQCFEAVGDYLHAYVLAVGLLDDQREMQGADHPDLFQLRFVVGDLMARVGDVQGALGQFRSLLDDQKNALGADHPSTVSTGHRIIAVSVANLGRSGESGPDTETEAALPGEIFAERLSAAMGLAEEGLMVEAVARALALLDTQLGTFGPGHPDTARTSALLSGWIGQIGGFGALPEALSELLATLEATDTIAEDVLIFDVRRAIVVAGDESESPLPVLLALLADAVSLYGPGYPDTLVLRGLVAARAEAADTPQVIEALHSLVAGQTELLGDAHPEVLRTRNLVADLTARSGDIESALVSFVEVLMDQQRALGTDHSDIFVTRWNIASWMGETGDLGHAIPLMQSLADDQVRLFGPHDPASMETRHTVGVWLIRAGQLDLATQRFEELLVDLKSAPGGTPTDAARTEAILADLRSGRLSSSRVDGP